MSVEQFTGTSVLSVLNKQLECSNYQSVQITNNSNYGFTLSNVGNRTVIGYVNPWENMIMPLDSIATLGIVVNNSLNSATPFTPIQTQELLQVQFSRLTVLGTSKTSSAVITSTNITSSGVLNVQFPSAQTVNATVTNEPTVNISGSGNTVEVAGTVNNNVVNEQLQMGGGYLGSTSFTVPASSTSSQTATVTFLTSKVLTGANFSLALISSEGYSYYYNIQRNVVIGSQTIPQDPDVTSSASTRYTATPYSPSSNPTPFVNEVFAYGLKTFNQITIQITPTASQANEDTAIFYFIAEGQPSDYVQIGWNDNGVAVLATPSTPLPNVPSFMLPGDSTYTGMGNGVPLPNQPYYWDSSSSSYVAINTGNPMPVYVSQVNNASPIESCGSGVLPTTATYTTTNSGVNGFMGVFGTIYNSNTSDEYWQLYVQNYNDTSQVYTLTWHIGPTTTLPFSFMFPYTTTPFGTSGVSLSFGWLGSASGMTGNMYAIGKSG